MPKSKHPVLGIQYDAILVIVDKLTKYIKFVPFDERYNIENLAFIIIDTLIRYHGVPKSITLDRDKLFISKYWSTLIVLLRIKRRLLIVYYP